MGWEFEHTAESTGTSEAVWDRYSDVTRWADWSPGVEWARLDGPFAVGSRGKNKAPGAPATRFRLTAVEPGRRFASEVRLPGARLGFEHLIESRERGVRIKHRATLDGPLAWLYAWRVRPLTEQNLVESVERLAAQAAEDE